MTIQTRFTYADSLGACDPSDIAGYLDSIDDQEGVLEILGPGLAGQGLFLNTATYAHTGFSVGFIKAQGVGSSAVPIVGAGHIKTDKSLIGKRIKITLDKFYVDNYPGTGTHQVLCEFAGKNQVPGEAEEMRFALRTSVMDGESASISGHPIFMGVTVGEDGISFEGRTINICSDTDETILATLDSPAFRSGLSLLTMAQPALKPFSGLAESVVKATLKRKKNKQIHNFNIGLDFGTTATSSRLQIGSYIVAQTDGGSWDWDAFIWDRTSMSLQPKQAGSPAPRMNYMVFGVTEFSSSK